GLSVVEIDAAVFVADREQPAVGAELGLARRERAGDLPHRPPRRRFVQDEADVRRFRRAGVVAERQGQAQGGTTVRAELRMAGQRRLGYRQFGEFLTGLDLPDRDRLARRREGERADGQEPAVVAEVVQPRVAEWEWPGRFGELDGRPEVLF